MSQNETILIIDDQHDSIEFLKNEVLRDTGCAVTVAYDGQQGLEKARCEKPDLVIVDLTVPKMSGLQVLQELRQARSDVPVILTTFHGVEEAAVRAFQLGAQGYVIKPYAVPEMRQAIEHGLNQSRLQKERDHLAGSVTGANRQVERRLKELSVLASIGKSITALLDEDRLLTRVVEAAVYITGAEEGFLLLVDEESGELYMRAARGLGEKYAREFRLKVKDSLAGQVVQTGKPIIVSSSDQDERLKVKTGYLVRSLLHVPLRVGESVIGVLSVDHMIEQRTFSDHDLYLLSTLADYTAIAIENARLHATLTRQVESQPAPQPAPQVAPPITAPAAAAPIQTAEWQNLQANLEAVHSETTSCIQEGKTILSTLGQQITALESRLDQVARQHAALDLALPQGRAGAPLGTMQQDLLTILNSLNDGVLAVDADNQVLLANQAAQAMLGGELVGDAVEEICDDPRWAKTYRIVKAAVHLDTDSPGSELTSASTPLTINQKMFRASFRLWPAAGSTSGGAVVVLRDITAEREAQRAKDSFIASVSQEIRTPMTSISGYTDLLLAKSVGPLGSTQTKFLERIRANADRIDGLLNDLVSMMILDSRQLELKAEAMDLAATIHEAAETVHGDIAAKEQHLDLELPTDLSYVQAGPDAVYHILTNLLQNAHRCSPPGAHIRLQVREIHEGDTHYVSVSVTDAGGGIAAGDHKKVFNRFYRSENRIVPGLGDPDASLPIVKVLAEANGGRLWLESQMGVGSTFAFILPIHTAA
jgi:signal transduction histidine kinase/DNA-binding response OmpR family regulator